MCLCIFTKIQFFSVIAENYSHINFLNLYLLMTGYDIKLLKRIFQNK